MRELAIMMNKGPWRKYPRYRPIDTEEIQDYVVLVKNPYYINKSPNSNKPKYWPELAVWHNGRFLDFKYNELKPVYFARLPKFPEE